MYKVEIILIKMEILEDGNIIYSRVTKKILAKNIEHQKYIYLKIDDLLHINKKFQDVEAYYYEENNKINYFIESVFVDREDFYTLRSIGLENLIING